MTSDVHPNGSAPSASFGRDDELHAYREMLRIRRFEEKAGQLYGMGFIGGFCHLCIGQEAVVVGVQMALEPGDQTITSYRNHGHLLASGVPPQAIMAELTGRAEGQSAGKGGSVHMFAPDLGFYGGHGIVGANVPIGAGLAFANAYRGNANVCFCSLGDGAADQGQVFEAMRLAQLWSLPIVFVIENNAVALPETGAGPDADPENSASGSEAAPASASLANRGAAFAIPGTVVDGMDVRAVKAAAERWGRRARDGGGPAVLEMRTQRYRGHSMAEPAKYAGGGGGARVQPARDPIERCRARILEGQLASEDELREIDRAIRDEVSAAADFAQSAAEPDAVTLTTDVTHTAVGFG